MTTKRSQKRQETKHSPAKLSRFAKVANENHGKVTKHWLGLANNARKAGEALAEAHSCCPHGKWKKWLKDNFNGSYETAMVYIKIAKK